MRSIFRRLRHDQKCKKRKLSQDMQLTQKLRDDQKHMKKSFEDVSGRNKGGAFKQIKIIKDNLKECWTSF
ncbi:hypothetical protein Tco_0791286 [Tanacetum coccineum]